MKFWLYQDYAQGYLTKGLNALESVLKEFIFKPKLNQNTEEANEGEETPSSGKFF